MRPKASSLFLMVAAVVELGWWAIAIAAAVGLLYYLRLKGQLGARGAPGEFLTVDEVRERLDRGERLLFADVRSESSYNSSATTVHGAVRLDPAHPLEDARKLAVPPGERIVAFCA